MNEKSVSNNCENYDPNLNNAESHYTNLINRLRDISKTIVLLEKAISK